MKSSSQEGEGGGKGKGFLLITKKEISFFPRSTRDQGGKRIFFIKSYRKKILIFEVSQ